MELRQLGYFVTVAEAGSFSRAALSLEVAQPALSRQIGKLEEEFGVRLLNRNGRGVSLTPAGEILLRSARDVLTRVEVTAREMSAIANRLSGSAVVGLPPTVGRVLSTPLARTFRQHFPEVRLQIAEGFSGNVLEWLSTGRVDVGVLYSDPGLGAMVAEPLVEEELLLIGSPEALDRPEGEAVPFSCVARLPLILPSRPHGLRGLLDRLADERGTTLNVVMEVDSLFTMLDLTRQGLGYTILPPASVLRDPGGAGFRLWPVVEPPVRRTLYLATGNQRATAVAKRELARIVRRQILDLETEGFWRAVERIF